MPPKASLRFLRWFCREDYIDEIEGDLIELFEKDSVINPRFASWLFTWRVIKHFRPAFVKSFSSQRSPISISMMHHILLVSLRNFSRYKQAFLINLLGLTAGLTSVLLIYLWVHDEISIDQFHENKERLYQVRRNTPGPDKTSETHESNSVLLPEVLRKEMPEVEYVVPFRPVDRATVSVGGERIEAIGAFAGEDFFKAFSFPLIYGNVNSALSAKYNMAISSELAIKLFGSPELCIGKPINWDLQHFGGDFVISAVFEKSPHTSERFDFLMTYEMFLEKNRMDVNWNSNPIIVNITLSPGVEAHEFGRKLQDLYVSKRFVSEKWNGDRMFIQKYSTLYLHSRYENGILVGGRIDYVIMFSLVAASILLIACINFMNLSTARAQTRMKEVGIKKGLGARRASLIFQHLSESIIISMFALSVSVILVVMLLPEFNETSGKYIMLQDCWQLLPPAIVIAIITGLAAGSYPAFYLSGFKPTEILKGKFSSKKQATFIRRGLVIFQFIIAIALMIGVAVVYRQLDYVQSLDLGYEKENVILIEQQGQLNTRLNAFLERARQTTGVLAASATAASIIDNTSSSWGHTWEGRSPGAAEVDFSGANVDYDLIETLGIKMKYGRSFSPKFSDENSKVIINEAAMKAMGMTDPIGKWIELFGTKREIIGVTNDYRYQSLYSATRPQFMVLGLWRPGTIVIRIAEDSQHATIENIKTVFKDLNPDMAFEFSFLDDEYQALYVSEQRVSKLAQFFACVAIVLSCLGLFGLAAFAAATRTKEISIRKVLGCSEWRIAKMLTIEFVSMVGIAALIAAPMSWYLAEEWLQTFAYRSDLPLWLFAAAMLIVLSTALLTVGMQIIKAARSNPAANLKSE